MRTLRLKKRAMRPSGQQQQRRENTDQAIHVRGGGWPRVWPPEKARIYTGLRALCLAKTCKSMLHIHRHQIINTKQTDQKKTGTRRCPKCVLNVDQVVIHCHGTPPCSWTFPTSLFFHAATSSIRDTIHHPYISTCFCEKHFYSVVQLTNTHGSKRPE